METTGEAYRGGGCVGGSKARFALQALCLLVLLLPEATPQGQASEVAASDLAS